MTKSQLELGTLFKYKLLNKLDVVQEKYGFIIEKPEKAKSYYVLWEDGKVEHRPLFRNEKYFDYVLTFNPELLKNYDYKALTTLMQLFKMGLTFASQFSDIKDKELVPEKLIAKFRFMQNDRN